MIPSLVDPSGSGNSIISSPVFASEERIFDFGILIPSKVPEGMVEKFKIMNPNKIPCIVNFKILKTESKTEGFAFEVSPA